MSHDFGTIRISQQGKEQLIKLKRVTGIKNWNTLCRMALCLSLSDGSHPLPQAQPDSNVEMTWKTFAGNDSVPLASLLLLRASATGVTGQQVLHTHLHRGIGLLSGAVSRDDSIEPVIELFTLTK